MDRGAWQATVHEVTESDMTEATWRGHMHSAASYMEVWCVICSGVSRLSATSWTVVCQATLTMEFSRQEYWSDFPFPSQRDLPNPGIKPESPALQADSLPSEPPGMPLYCLTHSFYMKNGCKWLRAMKQIMHCILAERVGILRVNSRKLCSEFCRGWKRWLVFCEEISHLSSTVLLACNRLLQQAVLRVCLEDWEWFSWIWHLNKNKAHMVSTSYATWPYSLPQSKVNLKRELTFIEYLLYARRCETYIIVHRLLTVSYLFLTMLSTKELMLLNCGTGEDSWKVPWTARRPNQSIL